MPKSTSCSCCNGPNQAVAKGRRYSTRAAIEGTSIKALVLRALDEYLQELEKQSLLPKGQMKMMTTKQAAQLREDWKHQVVASMCEHVGLELESTEQGHLTGHHNCTVCGARVMKTQRSAATLMSVVLTDPYDKFIEKLHAEGRITNEEVQTLRQALKDQISQLSKLVKSQGHSVVRRDE